MARLLRYLTHPQVNIDPDTPVPDWGLSDLGRDRARRIAELSCLAETTSLISSAERKAVETAEVVSAAIGVPIHIREQTHENDRSATGFLKPAEFEQVANQFFASPSQSIRGWERAVDAQARIVREASHVMRESPAGDILMVGHGGVGTLLYCHLAGLEISRVHDQPGGGGCLFTYDIDAQTVQHAWKTIEQVAEALDE